MLKDGCEGPCSWFAECQSMCDSKLPCGISLDNVEASLRINQQLKAEIAAIATEFDRLGPGSCGGEHLKSFYDLVIKLRQLSAV